MKDDLKRFYLDLNDNPDLVEELNELKHEYCDDFLSQEEAYDFVENQLIPFAESLGYKFEMRDYIEFESENQMYISSRGLDLISGGVETPFSTLLDIPLLSPGDETLPTEDDIPRSDFDF
ncbi:MAG: hypothetical protein LBH37_03170 [Oscillospiraceae bacterium]|jgi:hypothetical protein|nr:hypothetical protein [Oscillospiraceae bacterium]